MPGSEIPHSVREDRLSRGPRFVQTPELGFNYFKARLNILPTLVLGNSS